MVIHDASRSSISSNDVLVFGGGEGFRYGGAFVAVFDDYEFVVPVRVAGPGYAVAVFELDPPPAILAGEPVYDGVSGVGGVHGSAE